MTETEDVLTVEQIYLGQTEGYKHCVELLAQPYADHPDFREEWRL